MKNRTIITISIISISLAVANIFYNENWEKNEKKIIEKPNVYIYDSLSKNTNFIIDSSKKCNYKIIKSQKGFNKNEVIMFSILIDKINLKNNLYKNNCKFIIKELTKKYEFEYDQIHIQIFDNLNALNLNEKGENLNSNFTLSKKQSEFIQLHLICETSLVNFDKLITPPPIKISNKIILEYFPGILGSSWNMKLENPYNNKYSCTEYLSLD